ncbi:MAG: hypothetical protein V1736_09915 [Pseudomonadota bacterium]
MQISDVITLDQYTMMEIRIVRADYIQHRKPLDRQLFSVLTVHVCR